MRKAYLNFVIELELRIMTLWFSIFSFERRWQKEWEQRKRWQSGNDDDEVRMDEVETTMTKWERRRWLGNVRREGGRERLKHVFDFGVYV